MTKNRKRKPSTGNFLSEKDTMVTMDHQVTIQQIFDVFIHFEMLLNEIDQECINATMFALSDPRISNPVLSALKINSEDRIISIKENSSADSNFILSHLIKQILYEKNKLCFVNFHNPLEHYQYVGKKLGYDLLKAVAEKQMKIVEPIRDIVENIGLDEDYLQDDKDNLLRDLCCSIKKNIDDLLDDNKAVTYLMVDDLSHLLDLGVDIELVVNFVNYCVNLIDNERVSVILSSHASSSLDEIIVNTLQYIADVHIVVSPLKTGRSLDVTGFLAVERVSGKSLYHFKAFDRGIKTFHPGESIFSINSGQPRL